MPSLSRPAARIHYEVAGSGPTLLATHGFAGSSADWADGATELAAQSRVVTWDLRGHGSTTTPDDPGAYSVELALSDMEGLLDATSTGAAGQTAGAILMGHSLGGFLSLELLLRSPERVAALILVGTGPGYRDAAGRAKWNDLVEAVAAAETSEGRHHAAHAARGILAQHDARVIDALATVGVPTLIVCGERDTRFMNGSNYMAAKIPGATLAVIPGAGHTPQRSQPAALLAAVNPFLARQVVA